jgi:hypothetical protein
MYEQLGWTLPDGGAVNKGKKRVAKAGEEDGADEGAGPETPTKKPRTPRKKKEKAPSVEVKKSDDEEAEGKDINAGAKQEQVEEEE